MRPAASAEEVFPYTYHRWTGGGMDVSIENSGRRSGGVRSMSRLSQR